MGFVSIDLNIFGERRIDFVLVRKQQAVGAVFLP